MESGIVVAETQEEPSEEDCQLQADSNAPDALLLKYRLVAEDADVSVIMLKEELVAEVKLPELAISVIPDSGTVAFKEEKVAVPEVGVAVLPVIVLQTPVVVIARLTLVA